MILESWPALQFDAQVLKPGESVVQQFTTYAGPKEYRLLEAHALTYGNSIDSVMGFDGFFGFFAKILLWAMSSIHSSFGLGYALCIIVITIHHQDSVLASHPGQHHFHETHGRLSTADG